MFSPRFDSVTRRVPALLRRSPQLLMPVAMMTTMMMLSGHGTAVATATYGMDCSFPVRSRELKCDRGLLGDRRAVYEDFMNGCRKKYSHRPNRCDATEEGRFRASLRQPPSMVNYTETGYAKTRAPDDLMKLLTDHWNKNRDHRKEEIMATGNTFTNHWSSPTYMVGVEDTGLRGAGGRMLRSSIWSSVRPALERWTGMELDPMSIYGIRQYSDGAILSPHVDRIPLVSSCIVCVSQDVDEDWVLELYDRHDGNAVNITLNPGDMLLYESASIIHGRPFAMRGRYYADVYVHFEPTGRKLGADGEFEDVPSLDDSLPPYLVPGTPEVSNWKYQNPYGWKKLPPELSAPEPGAQFEGHYAAAVGDMDRLSRLAEENRDALLQKDANGWRPLHEAVRAGRMDVVEMLVRHGADINARTGLHDEGASPLNIAYEILRSADPLTKYLLSLGAENIEPDL